MRPTRWYVLQVDEEVQDKVSIMMRNERVSQSDALKSLDKERLKKNRPAKQSKRQDPDDDSDEGIQDGWE
jgi:hypothetical protein